MCIHRLKVKLLTKEQIKELHKKKNIVTEKTPDYLVKCIINDLKNGVAQIEVSRKYDISPTIICRLAKKHNIKSKHKHRGISDEVKKGIKNDFSIMAIDKLMEKYNLSKSTIYKYIH